MTAATHPTQGPAGALPTPAPAGAPIPPVPDASALNDDDGSTRTGRRVAIRVGIYIFALHVFAGFLMLIFALGAHHQH